MDKRLARIQGLAAIKVIDKADNRPKGISVQRHVMPEFELKRSAPLASRMLAHLRGTPMPLPKAKVYTVSLPPLSVGPRLVPQRLKSIAEIEGVGRTLQAFQNAARRHG